MRLKMKNGSRRHNVNRTRPRHGCDSVIGLKVH